MTMPIGTAGRDGDDLLIRLTAGPRRGRFRVPAAEVGPLLAGLSAVVRDEEGAAVGDLATSRSLRVLTGAFRAGRGFVVQPAAFPVAAPAFLVPRAHLAAHYDRHDGPVPVLAGGA